MRLIRLIGFYWEVIKGLTRLLLYLSNKCIKLLIAVLVAVVLVSVTCGVFVGTISAILGVVFVIYNLCDYLLFAANEPADSRSNVLSPMAFNLPFESLFITTEDGVHINLLLVKRPDTDYKWCPTVVYFHGNAGNIGHRLQNCYEMYHQICCNILLVEYRGYGLSGGRPSERGLYKDAEAALNYLLGRPDIDNNKIVVFGRSLGGAVAIELAAHVKYRSMIAAVIVENTFTSLPDIARTIFNCRAIRSLPNWFYKNQFNSLTKVSAMSVPALFISGLSDELIPSSMMTTLYTICSSGHKELHRLDGTHNFTWKCSNYYSIIRLFLSKVLQQNVQQIGELSPYLATNTLSTPTTGSQPQQQSYNQTLITFDDNNDTCDRKTIDI